MSVETRAIVKDDIKEVITTLEKVGRREGFTVKFESERYKEEGFSRIILTELGRVVTIYDYNKLTKGINFPKLAKEVLPKNGRTLKNSKNGIILSLGSDGASQKLLFTFLKEFPTHGYLQLKDSNRGGFIFVDKTGFVKTNKDRSPQEMQLVTYFNGMASEVITNEEEVSKETKETILKVYYKYSYRDNGEVYTYRVGGKVVDEVVVFSKTGKVYLLDGTAFRDLRDAKSYCTPQWVNSLIKLSVAQDIGKRDFEDIFRY